MQIISPINRAVGLTRISNFFQFLYTTTQQTLVNISLKQNVTKISHSYKNLLKQCSETKSITDLRTTHLHMIKSGFPHLSLGNKLIHAYLKCETIDDAHKLFDEMPQRHIVMWNSMVSAYIRHKRSFEAVRLYHKMTLEGVFADEFTFSSVFKAFTALGFLLKGRIAHGRLVVSGLEESNVFIGSALVDMYSKFGEMGVARLVFDRVVEKDVVLATTLIVGYTQYGEDGEAIGVFLNMLSEGIKPNDFTFSSVLVACGNLAEMIIGKQIHGHIMKFGLEEAVATRTSLLTMYSKCGLIDDCFKVFHGFFNATLVTWTAVMMGLVQHGREEEAILMFRQMICSSICPNCFTLSTILRACSSLAMLEQGKQIHAVVLKTGVDTDKFVGAALIDMYGRCGSIEMAKSVFINSDGLDLVSVNSMIYGYAQSGNGYEAVKLFDQMQDRGIQPNDVTFVSVLSACSNAGLLEEGQRIFSSLRNNTNVVMSRDHYTCMVDLLGRAGRLKEAEMLIIQVKNPDVVMWRTLLSACRIHGDVEMANRIMNNVIELKPGDEGAHILLSNIYASMGRWNEVIKVKTMMKDMEFKKNPAMCWVEVNREVHTFMAGDLSHPRATEIEKELEGLGEKIAVLGYLPDTSYVLQDLVEQEKKRSLCYHSEKLAIAFGLLASSKQNTTIRIFKNLRVCGDCHTWIKFVSKVVGREIVARDAKRFHHFTDGLCSCGDYW